METIYCNQVMCTVTQREDGGFVLKTSNNVTFEFSNTFPTSAAIIGLIDKTICDTLSYFSYEVLEFSFSLQLKEL